MSVEKGRWNSKSCKSFVEARKVICLKGVEKRKKEGSKGRNKEINGNRKDINIEEKQGKRRRKVRKK
jgi:hypothetical protein